MNYRSQILLLTQRQMSLGTKCFNGHAPYEALLNTKEPMRQILII